MLRLLLVALLGVAVPRPVAAQFVLQGAPTTLSLTTFASGLNFPVGMAELPDGSVLVAVSNGDSFYGATSGRLIRLVDADDDGVAETQQTLVADVPGASPTAVRVAGRLVVVTGQGQPVVVYRLGTDLSAPLALVGQLTATYPGDWLHKHSALAVRPDAAVPGRTEVWLQVGSRANFAATTTTVPLTSDLGLTGALAGDAVYRFVLTDTGTSVVASDLEQIATGLRNATGLAFQPSTGDLYLVDNGIDGLASPDEPHSADEVNVIPAAQIGGAVEDFGFPDSYVAYRTGTVVGSRGIQPLVAIQPLPDPQTGAEAEGPNDAVFAPPLFAPELTGHLVIGFHGRFTTGGTDNEENPLVTVDPATGAYAHLVAADEPGVGHLDGLMARGRDLFVADLATTGFIDPRGADTGAVYRIRYTGFPDTSDDGAAATGASLVAAPSPFRGATTITLTTPVANRVRVDVLDALGRTVAVLHDGPVADERPLHLDGRALPAGVYTVRARGEGVRLFRRIVRLR